jgi:hypothetical protein
MTQYSNIEHEIIKWVLDGTKTAGELTRTITSLIHKPNYVIIMEGDINDGDMITEATVITNSEYKKHGYGKLTTFDVELFRKIAKIVMDKNGKNGRYETNDQASTSLNNQYKDLLTEDEIEFFNDFVPYHEYGIHTIDSIILVEAGNIEDLSNN